MDQETEKIVKAVTTAGIIGTLAASAKYLLSDAPPAKKIRAFVAGVIVSLLLGYGLMNSNLTQFWYTILVAGCSAFITNLWPVAEKAFVLWFTKKTNDVISNNNDSQHPG